MIDHQEVIKRSKELWDQERAAVIQESGRLLSITKGLPRGHDLVSLRDDVSLFSEDIPENFELLPNAPTIGTCLLRTAYMEFRANSEPGYPAVKATRNSRLSVIVNGFLLPMCGLTSESEDVQPYEATMSGSRVKYACSEAELFFFNVYAQVASDHDYDQKKISVYHDESGRPLALRKSFVASTALTLVPLMIDGVALPPSSIVTLDPSMTSENNRTGFKKRDHDTLSTYCVSGSLAVHPHRASSWAFDDVLNRAQFALGGKVSDRHVSAANLDALETLSRQDFTDLSIYIMGLCGVSTAVTI